MPPMPTSSRYGAHAGARRVKQADLEVLPSMDLPSYYDPPSPSSSTSEEEDIVTSHFASNSGHKLQDGARWQRTGKMCAWGPSYDETVRKKNNRKRLQVCLEQFMPDAAAEAGVTPPQNIVKAEERRRERKRRKQEDSEFRLPHLPSPSPPLSTIELAPMLSLPRSYLDVVTSPAMRYSLGNDSMERGLQKTAADLLEGEKGLMQALGRLREVLRVRDSDVPEGSSNIRVNGAPANAPEPPAAANGEAANGHETEVDASEATGLIPPLPHISDTDNLWRVSQELLAAVPPPIITFSATPPGAAAPTTATAYTPKPTPLHRIFTCPTGMTISAMPNHSHPNLQGIPKTHPLYPKPVKYNLDMPTQQKAVDDAMERILELLADCNEYKERLEEARERVSDVARVRKMVWKQVQKRAGRELDKIEGK